MKIIVNLVIITILAFFLVACSNSGLIYNSNTKYDYLVSNNLNTTVDSLSIETVDKIFNDFKIKWTFTTQKENKKLITTIEDRFKENEEYLKIPPPQSLYLKKLVLFAYPQVKFPLEIGKTWEESTKVDSKNEYNGTNKDITVNVVSKEDLMILGNNITCWKIKNIAKSKEGKYESIYYFNEKLGFVKLVYDIEDLIYTIQLERLTKTIIK
jgi:hypothetical protein